MTEKETMELKLAFEMIWQAIGVDVLAEVPSASITRDEVVELVLDADRMTTFCHYESKPTVEKFNKLDYEERIKIAKEYFIFERYGY